MNDVIHTHQDYWRILRAYHINPLSQRPDLLAGFIQFNSMQHPDPKTRQLLAEFYAQEVLRHGKSAETHRPSA